MKNFIVLLGLIIGLSSFQQPSTAVSSLPKGAIIGWGLRTPIPRNWAICNGVNGTPDLVGRFPYGTANSAEIGTKLGQPDHSHTVTGTTSIPNDITDRSGDNKALQKDGNERFHHNHVFSATTSTVPLIPPATKIIFIMKIR